MGAPNKKNGGCPIRIPKAFRSEEFGKQEDSRAGSRRYISWPRLNVVEAKTEVSIEYCVV